MAPLWGHDVRPDVRPKRKKMSFDAGTLIGVARGKRTGRDPSFRGMEKRKTEELTLEVTMSTSSGGSRPLSSQRSVWHSTTRNRAATWRGDTHAYSTGLENREEEKRTDRVKGHLWEEKTAVHPNRGHQGVFIEGVGNPKAFGRRELGKTTDPKAHRNKSNGGGESSVVARLMIRKTSQKRDEK